MRSKKLRRLAKYLWVYFLYLTGLLWWAKRRLCARGATVVLTLHRVLDGAEFGVTSSLPGIVVRRDTFAEMARYLRECCHPIDLSAEPSHRPGPGRKVPVAVTFDDGWKDNYQVAYPIAAQHGVPMTIFVCPALAGRAFPFWPEVATICWRKSHDGGPAEPLALRYESPDSLVEHLKGLSAGEPRRILAGTQAVLAAAAPEEPTNAAMTWEEMERMQSRGVVFGSHTLNHEILPRLDAGGVRHELEASKREIEGRLGGECDLFAYPNGDWSPAIREQVEAVGYRFAFTTRPGAWTRRTEALLIPRINVSENRITGWDGAFSRAAFEYAVFWKAARAS